MIWLIGSNGMLGREVAYQLTQNNLTWVGTNSDVDITNINDLESFSEAHNSNAGRTGYAATRKTVPEKITWVINCAAYTAVDKAEDEENIARKVNTDGALNVARTARSMGARLIHISTDYVFDGTAAVPYKEDNPKYPLNVYGVTKSLGEDAIQKEMTQYYIFRASWLYGYCGNNFVYKMTKLMNTNPSVKVVNDQRGTPTNCSTLASIIIRIITTADNAKSLFCKKAPVPYGIYNCSDGGDATWYDFAKKIYELGRKYNRITQECSIEPCTTNDFPVKAKRPPYSIMDKTKLQNALRMKLPEWKESLEKFVKSDKFKAE